MNNDITTTFTVKFSYKGKSISVENISYETTASDLLSKARSSYQDIDDDIILRLIFKGKTIAQETVNSTNDNDADINQQPAFSSNIKVPKSGIAKVIIMGSTTSTAIQQLNSLKSDPLMRGFDEENKANNAKKNTLSTYWGTRFTQQHKQYKFCKLQECTDASFGSRTDRINAPHAFEARRLLERLATDPGIIALLVKRQLVVGTLGEIDPIDDRLMQSKASEGACLLGYNTNHGLRIDIKLRTDDLSSFRPYKELVSTLIHELSHNWCSEHDVLFWTNYGQMRVEYLYKHARLMNGGIFVGGKRTAELAGVVDMIFPPSASSVSSPSSASSSSSSSSSSPESVMNNICQSIIQECAREMAQHRLPVQLIIPGILSFSKELMAETEKEEDTHTGGYKLGTLDNQSNTQRRDDDTTAGLSVRERTLAAAEKRAREQKKE